VSKQIVKNFLGILQVRSEYRWKDENTSISDPNTGNWIMYLCPQLTYAIAGRWNLSFLVDIPVYKDYNGKQLTPNHSAALSLSHDFNFKKSSMAKTEIKEIKE
jgi:hypothetical protein